jgi:hypothetical protein
MEFKKMSKEDMKHVQFAKLYPKFVEGKKRLDSALAIGKNVRKETDAFTLNIILPLHRLWESLKAEEKAMLDRIMTVYEKFGGKSMRFNPEVR